MTKKTIAMLCLLGMLLVSSFGTAAAQAGDEPTVTPTDVVTEAPEAGTGTKFFTHPVVQLLSAYFDRDWQPVEDTNSTPLATPDPLATPAPGDTGGEVGPGPIGEQIAAYHEDGVGFGVLVKIFAMAEAAQAACLAGDGVVIPADPSAEACVPVSAEELVATFKSGTGLGQLYQEYGKPALLGAGQIKKALRNAPGLDEPVTIDPVDEGAAFGPGAKGGKPEKVKPDNGKGPKK